jgi:putative hydrolase of the HAD superfamily
VILTDGRSITQRLKLHALGLSHLKAYISEEWASEKPDDRRFRQIMVDFQAASYVYVADNPRKDFVAPNLLDWLTVGLRASGKSIHSQDCEGLPSGYSPRKWIRGWDELMESLC